MKLDIKGACAAILLCLSCGAVAAPPAACPQTLRDGDKVGELADADVFQGPPEENASLMPSLGTAEWKLAGYQQNAKERGESLYLICRYAGTTTTVALEIPQSARVCKVHTTKDRTTAACK